MRQTKLFTKTRKEAPKDEVSRNAQLLIRGGFIHKEMAGVYDLLPLGLRVIKKIEQIIREEMNKIDGQEVELSALQEKDSWEKTGRWDDETLDVWFKTKLKNETEIGLGVTHEEPLTKLMVDHISSYKDLPKYVYQFQTKFRNELRSKSGMMRGREFLMKDLYSFSKNETEHEEFYKKARTAYTNVFDRIGIGHITYYTSASGGSFGDFSHEFQTITDAGEDIIFVDENTKTAINKEIYNDEQLQKLGLDKSDLIEKKSVEVGNIFPLGTKFSDALGLNYIDAENKSNKIIMGSYGIGLGRLMGTVVEVLSDEKGIVWPESIAPYKVHLINVSPDSLGVVHYADSLYEDLKATGIEVLYDDRDVRAGEKLGDSDLLGIPHRIVVGKKSLEQKTLEYTLRSTGETQELTEESVIQRLSR